MKKSYSLLVLLCLSTMAFGQQFYTVYVGAFINAQSSDFDRIRPTGFVYANKMDNNVYRVFMGGYNTAQEAEQIAGLLRQKGYGNAQAQELLLNEGGPTTVIQLATYQSDDAIDWAKHLEVGELLVILDGATVRIVTGPYADVLAAKRALPDIQKQGYKDAFIKSNVNTMQLYRVTEFETGIKKPLFPISINQQPAAMQQRQAAQQTQQPQSYDVLYPRQVPTQQPYSYDIPSYTPPGSQQQQQAKGSEYGIIVPRSYEQTGDKLTPKSPAATTTKAATATPPKPSLPNIRGKIKRKSALELQKALKAEGFYSGSLDGYYGSGTANAYTNAKKGSRLLAKYQVVSQHGNLVTGASSDPLQLALDNLIYDGAAVDAIEKSTKPIAKAYQAYLLFVALGPDKDVNSLMNAAIKGIYAGASAKTTAGFDYRATYAYEDLAQLILHLHYLHCAPGNTYAAPCWLSQKHPKETATAVANASAYAGKDFKMQTCDPFQSWEEIRMLEAIALDLNTDDKLDGAALAAAAAQRAQLILSPKALSKTDLQKLETWDQRLWENMTHWSARDPLHHEMASALKIVYFQSEVRLEDYFMDKGLKQEEARGLALAVLHTLVNYHLERFI